MASHRMATWRWSIGCATLWVILAVRVASTLEIFDEGPAVHSDFSNEYQEENYIGSVPDFRKPNTHFKSPPEDLLLNELLKASRDNMDYRQTWDSLYLKPKPAVEDHTNSGLEKFEIVKRVADVLRGSWMQYRPSQSLRPQRKWKIKKGKVGSQMVCYFKLCAFRSPA